MRARRAGLCSRGGALSRVEVKREEAEGGVRGCRQNVYDEPRSGLRCAVAPVADQIRCQSQVTLVTGHGVVTCHPVRVTVTSLL